MWLRRSQWHGHVRGKRHRHNARLQLAADACTSGPLSGSLAHDRRFGFTSDERFWAREAAR
eukprot:2780428-Lingulodinium_polyedra.AAC.1